SRIVDVRNYLDFLAAALVEEFLAEHPEETFESYVSRLEAALDDASGGAAEERKEKVHRAK
ncbi:MAG: hypothetical protein QJR13_09610, partial [Bacillota bacterium]|nr:hypothetical protein [Bacillota bacterium]